MLLELFTLSFKPFVLFLDYKKLRFKLECLFFTLRKLSSVEFIFLLKWTLFLLYFNEILTQSGDLLSLPNYQFFNITFLLQLGI